ncbi:uncharacterized protein LOC128548266 [Mercenaria mercenaria]|uniref:uncharacterized protein LOC128548266 n=1 Tax=Mercenaria mercenaria TaxID=6596 RepID=UPI00234F79D5|nr:uncharacterized protein LOC128548266 [Mercenaria mercenaria]
MDSRNTGVNTMSNTLPYSNETTPTNAQRAEEDELIIFPFYSFERQMHAIIWPVLVLALLLVNVLVISVLLRKNMRNTTYMILVAIAISDTLTGLLTLPGYISVYQNIDNFISTSDFIVFLEHYLIYSGYESKPPDNLASNYSNGFEQSLKNQTHSPMANTSEHKLSAAGQTILNSYATFLKRSESDGVLFLYQVQCRAIMLSKYFILRVMHTISIFLTVFLAIQRYISVAYPLKAERLFKKTTVLIVCVLIFILSPILHIHHIVVDMADGGVCGWKFSKDSVGDGVYIWSLFFFRHFVPCVLLITLTGLFVKNLKVNERKSGRIEKCNRTPSRSIKSTPERRRITVIVVAVVVVFLIPEIPYGIYLFLESLSFHFDNIELVGNLKTKRYIHYCYEFLLLVSFHANFYIFCLLNKCFRKNLKEIFKSLTHVFGNLFEKNEEK